MINQPNSHNIYKELQLLDEATNAHNSAFDEANNIFSDVEKSLQRVKTESWYPYYLVPRPQLTSITPAPIIPNSLFTHAFKQITYRLGFSSGRLIVAKVTTEYEYIRDAWNNVLIGPNNVPYTNVVSETLDEPIAAIECSRDIRVMVIENLQGFLGFVRSSLEGHTNTLSSAIEYLTAD